MPPFDNFILEEIQTKQHRAIYKATTKVFSHRRDGLFPGTSCIKLSGLDRDSGQLVVVRGCALDSGGTTADTELVRISNCGAFQFEDK